MRANLKKCSTVSFIALSILLSSCTYNHTPERTALEKVSDKNDIKMTSLHFNEFLDDEITFIHSFESQRNYIQNVLMKLIAAGSHTYKAGQVYIIDNSKPVVWSLPGNRIAISWGMLMQVNSEAELAAILSHELAHQTLGHSISNIDRALSKEFNSLRFSNENLSLETLKLLRDKTSSVSFSIQQELDADSFAIQLLKKSGYSLSVYIRSQQILLNKVNEFSQSEMHPINTSRLQHINELCKGFDHGFIGTKEYTNGINAFRVLNNLQANLNKVDSYIQNKNFNKARSILDSIDKQYSFQYPPVLRAKAIIYYKLQDTIGALDIAHRLNELEPENYQNSYLLGFLYYHQKSYSTAIEFLDKSLSIKASDAAIYYQSCSSMQLGDSDQALEQFKSLVQSGSDFWANLAQKKVLEIDFSANPQNYIYIKRTTSPNEVVLENLTLYSFDRISLKILQDNKYVYGSSAIITDFAAKDSVSIQMPFLVSDSPQLSLVVDSWN